MGLLESLLSLSAKIDHSPEPPFKCFEIMVALLVGLWSAYSCDIQDVGRAVAYRFLRVGPFPMLSATIGLDNHNISLLQRIFGVRNPIPICT